MPDTCNLMSFLKLKPIINKANGQITTCLRKKDLPKIYLDILKDKPLKFKFLKMRLEGFE